MSKQLDWLSAELQTLTDEGLLRRRREMRPLSDGRCLVDGIKAWDFASNDYLGLANDPRVVAAALDALRTHGVGAKASPLVSGRTDLHVQLEEALAKFEGSQAAIVFPTGMAANMGTVAALAGAGDTVYCDRLNHASLVEGCRMSGATLKVYRHQDLDGLDQWLQRDTARRKFIITDSVFSMDGDQAPLIELCEIGERHGAALLVDEAHGTGVFGTRGRGVAEELGVEDRVAVRIGTLSKAVGALGGFVTGDQTLIDYLWNKARTQIYSTALPPAVCAAATVALGIIQSEPSRRVRLKDLVISFRTRLQQAGVSVLAGSVGPIVPIVLNDPDMAMLVADRLLQRGFLVGAIRPPTVPRGTSRLRITLHYGLSHEAVTELTRTIPGIIRDASMSDR